MKRLFLALALGASLVASVFAEPLSEKSKADLSTFVTAAQKEVTATGAKSTPVPSVEEERFGGNGAAMMLHALREQSAHADSRQIIDSLTQLSLYLPTDSLRLKAEALAVQIEAEQTAANAAQNQEIEKTLADAAATVRQATAPGELDPVLEKLSALNARRQELQQSSPLATVLTQRIKTALDFTTEWQDYLSLRQAGSHQTFEVLGTLSQHVWSDAIPRSEILALVHGHPWAAPASVTLSKSGVDEILQQIKTPADLGPAMDALSKFAQVDREQRGISEDTGLTATIKNLADLEQAYREFQAGLSTKLTLVVTETYRYQPYQSLTASVRAQVLTLVLPRYLGLPEGTTAQPGEGPYPFLDRIAAEASRRGDYLLAAKARDAQALIRDGRSYGGQESSQAGQYIIARNQETAGQFALAVANYEKALASASELVPAKAIGERLAAIKGEHPEEFQQGLNNYLTPPLPANYPGDPFRGSMYPRNRPPFGQPPGTTPTPPAPSLTIPPAPTPTPKTS